MGGPISCSDDDNDPVGPQLITISGKVRNVDTGEFAVGVRVSLYGNLSYADGAPTGTDGAYTIQVPAGSSVVLRTDDFDPATDAWFPLLNCDVPVINVDQLSEADRNAWPIHACPQTQAPQRGAVAIWDYYLANADDQTNGDLFAATTSANSGGVLSIVHSGCDSGAQASYDSISVSSSSASLPIAYMKAGWRQDPANGPDCIHPSTRTVTDRNGWAISFGDSNATDSTVVLTFSDMKPGRGLTWGPYECPVREGAISMVWALSIDGVTNKAFKETAICAGLITSSGAAARPVRDATP